MHFILIQPSNSRASSNAPIITLGITVDTNLTYSLRYLQIPFFIRKDY